MTAPLWHCSACRIEQPTARACDVCAKPVMLGELFDTGPAAFVVVAGRWDDGERNTKLISEPLTLDAALVEYAGCAGYPWRHIEYKGVCLDVLEVCQ